MTLDRQRKQEVTRSPYRWRHSTMYDCCEKECVFRAIRASLPADTAFMVILQKDITISLTGT